MLFLYSTQLQFHDFWLVLSDVPHCNSFENYAETVSLICSKEIDTLFSIFQSICFLSLESLSWVVAETSSSSSFSKNQSRSLVLLPSCLTFGLCLG
jgi:hypothetical protein